MNYSSNINKDRDFSFNLFTYVPGCCQIVGQTLPSKQIYLDDLSVAAFNSDSNLLREKKKGETFNSRAVVQGQLHKARTIIGSAGCRALSAGGKRG